MARRLVGPRWRRSAVLCLLLAANAPAAAAQGIAGSFEQLQVLVKPGDTVTVTDATGVETKGKIAALSISTLALLAGGTRRELSENDVPTVQQPGKECLANGALSRAAGGAGFATTAMIVFEEEGWDASEVAIVLGIYTAIGTGIGVAVDAMIRRHHVIYRRQPASGVHMGIAPWLTRHHQGVLVTLRF
jgi:hypothetical protein